MQNLPDSISSLDVAGETFDIGYAAGRYGRATVHEHLLSSAIWVMTQAVSCQVYDEH